MVDFDISLLALIDGVRIGGSNDDKGYGGFSPRIKLSVDQTYRATSGDVEPTTMAIDAGPWVDVSGATSGITMISHSKNPGNPERWILRRRRSMQNAVFPGRHPMPLSTEIPTRLRYRLVVHDGKLDSQQIENLFHRFSDTH